MMRSIITIILILKILNVVAAANSDSFLQKNSTIIFISVVVAAILVVIIGLACLFFCRRKRRRPKISPKNIEKVKRKYRRSGGSNISFPSESSAKLVDTPMPMQKILTTSLTKETVKPQTRSTTSSTGTTTPSQPPQTPLTPPTHHLQLSSTQTDLKKVSDKIAEIKEGSYQDTSSQGQHYKRHSSGPRGPRLDQQSQPSSDFSSQRTSSEIPQIRGSPSLQPVRTQEHSDFETTSSSRGSLSGEYRGSSLAYGGTPSSHDVSQALPHSWTITSPEAHDVYPVGPTSFESTLEQESHQEHPSYREPYETSPSYDPLQPQSRVSDASLFSEQTESEELGYGEQQHYHETGQRPRSSYRTHDPGMPALPPSLGRDRPSHGAPETDNPGAPSPPQHPLQRRGQSRRGRDRRGNIQQ